MSAPAHATGPTTDAGKQIATGPKTDAGKQIAARNSTTHGLYARDVVLPHLGEDPADFHALLQELLAQFRPANIPEQHHAEQIAAAIWKLRRLCRLHAALLAQDLAPDALLHRLDLVGRQEGRLNRQIDRSVRMLGHAVPQAFEARARRAMLARNRSTERQCKDDEYLDEFVTVQARDTLPARPLPGDPQEEGHEGDTQKRENEPPPPAPTPPELGAGGQSDPPEPGVGDAPDPPPPYATAEQWDYIQTLRAMGYTAAADDWDAKLRRHSADTPPHDKTLSQNWERAG